MPAKALSAAPAALLCAALSMALSGCAMMLTVPGEQMPPTDFDIAELAPGSLNTPVTDYSWSYTPGNTHVRVRGTVFNDTGKPLQSVMVMAVLHDQKGDPIAYGQSYLNTSYLSPG
ncbi:MAG: hypothetical protein LBQ12_12530, partial [Deltaproteobacteria bacterium]|nr:hypothetical protein [Deltaproteobacteria bacterium]